MNRTMLWALTASTAVAGTTYLYGQGTPVQLQPTTPGTAQIGHANVTGRIKASSVHVSDPTPTGQAIVGSATSTTGANFGGFFRSDSVLGRALYGRASATSGTTHGVWGQADSPGGRGVTGVVAATTGNATGVWGQTASTTGRGVYGFTTATSGVNYGVLGQSSSPAGFGVYSQGKMHATGVISGNGAGLTNVNAALLGGQSASAFLTSIPVPLNLIGSGAYIIRAQNSGGGGSASIFGISTASNGGSGGRFESASEDAHGLLGINTSPSGPISGVYGQSASFEGSGVIGVSTSSSGNTSGVIGQSASSTGRGVSGRATQTTGANFGVHGETLSTTTNAAGVFGFASASTGLTSGVWGQNNSSSGFGVLGINDNPSGTTYGVYGRSASPFGTGVYGLNTLTDGGYGVYGEAGGINSPGYGVYGKAFTIQGYAVYASGNLGVSGLKQFRIDHPHDPRNKYLVHYCTESPTPQNFYVGNVVTDAKGYGWVQLPDYFEDVNTNFKYLLTVVDDSETTSFVQVKVGKKIKGGRFLIMSSAPYTEVSWRVDADRNDLYVRRMKPKDVVDKAGLEKGTYQHPELYGFGPERGVGPRP